MIKRTDRSRALWSVLIGIGALGSWMSFSQATHREHRLTGVAYTKHRFLSAPPVIHAISVDKRSVCRGEENFVNVQAFEADGGDANLRVSLLGTTAMGMRMPFRLYGAPGEAVPRILVQGTGGGEVTAELPAVDVMDCETVQIAAIDLVALSASTDDWRFIARVGPGTFVPESYEWDFGDGTHLVSAEPQVLHSYRFRPQQKRYANFLIALTVRNKDGQTLRTSRALGFSNPAFSRFRLHGEVAIFSQRITQNDGQELIRLYHAYHAPVRIERVSLKVRSHDSRSEDLIGDYPAQETIGLGRLVPGKPAEVKLALANVDLATTRPLHLVFEVTGSTSDGIPASGVFSTQLL